MVKRSHKETFPGLPETSKMYIFTSIIQHLRTDNINVPGSKIYPSEFIFLAFIRDVNWVTYLGTALTGFYSI